MERARGIIYRLTEEISVPDTIIRFLHVFHVASHVIIERRVFVKFDILDLFAIFL